MLNLADYEFLFLMEVEDEALPVGLPPGMIAGGRLKPVGAILGVLCR